MNAENRIKDVISRGDQSAIGLYSEVVTPSDDYQASHGEIILVDASGGDVTITLPDPEVSNTTVTIKKIDSSGNAVNIETPESSTIDGQASLGVTNQYTSREVVSGGSDYYIK